MGTLPIAKGAPPVRLARQRMKDRLAGASGDSGIVALSVLERQLGLRRMPFSRAFVRLEQWWIAEWLLAKRFPRQRARQFPLLDIPMPESFDGNNSRLPLSCCAVYEGGESLRSFYPSRRVTIKTLVSRSDRERLHKSLRVGSQIAKVDEWRMRQVLTRDVDQASMEEPLRHGSLREQVRKDVQARTLVTKFSKLRVPKILTADSTGQCPFILEELILGHYLMPQDHDSIKRLVSEIWAAYQALGFSLTQSLPGLTLEEVEEELKRVLIPSHMKREGEIRDALVKSLKKLPSPAERPLLACFGHGDLSLGNIKVDGSGSLCIMDWEWSGRMAVVWDLPKLAVRVPNLLPEITNLIRMELHRLGWRDAMAAEDQCLLGLAGRVAARSRRARQRFSSALHCQTLKDLRRTGKCLQLGGLG